MLDSGAVPCYRFRVPENEIIGIDDIVRGRVEWNTDTLGDFVLLRSNGQVRRDALSQAAGGTRRTASESPHNAKGHDPLPPPLPRHLISVHCLPPAGGRRVHNAASLIRVQSGAVTWTRLRPARRCDGRGDNGCAVANKAQVS
jgi:hypothetical protein